MTINGRTYRLTQHGRRRYLERADPATTDAEILSRCVTDPRAVWRKRGKEERYRLVTYLPQRSTVP